MTTHSKRSLAALLVALPLLTGDLAPAAGPEPAGTLGLCASVPTPMPLPEGGPGGLGGLGELGELAAAVATTPQASLPALLGALGQMIVEAELSHAAVSGRFEPVISTTAAGSGLALEVCRDTIVGEVSVASRPGLRFVIGDFNGDGATDVALRRPDSRVWAVDLGALQHETADTAPESEPPEEPARPGAGPTATATHTPRLARGQRPGGTGPTSG